MPQEDRCQPRVDATELSGFCTRLLESAGLASADAALVADTLVEANLRGTDSHGVARLPHYLRRLRSGSIQPRPTVTTTDLGLAIARVDGGHGLGQVVMQRATQEAIRLARGAGAGWVSVCNSSHCGALAYYGLQIADAGMIGLVFTHVDSMVLPFASRQAFCGTNPLCITAPRAPSGAGALAAGALCLDMATSKVPWNKVVNATTEGASIPFGWAVDASGADTTNPAEVVALHAVGEYKGSGLGLMIDVLCALLSDAPLGPDIPAMYGDLSAQRRLGGLVGAIDISRFVTLERFHARLVDLIARWSALPSVDPENPVLYPGEPELSVRARRLTEGIPLGRTTREELDACAVELGVAGLAGGATFGAVTHGPHWSQAAEKRTSLQPQPRID